MSKKKSKFEASEMNELCRKLGVEVIQMKMPGHFRLVGALAVDFWPKGGSAWVFGTNKSWKPDSIQEVIDVANLKIFPEGVEWYSKKKVAPNVAKYINTEFCCPLCRKKVDEQKAKLYSERMIDLSELARESKAPVFNTKNYNGEFQ